MGLAAADGHCRFQPEAISSYMLLINSKSVVKNSIGFFRLSAPAKVYCGVAPAEFRTTSRTFDTQPRQHLMQTTTIISANISHLHSLHFHSNADRNAAKLTSTQLSDELSPVEAVHHMVHEDDGNDGDVMLEMLLQAVQCGENLPGSRTVSGCFPLQLQQIK